VEEAKEEIKCGKYDIGKTEERNKGEKKMKKRKEKT